MCRYIETFHEYSGCRLKETLPNGQPTRFAAFVKGVTNFVTGQNDEDDGANGETHGEDGPHHQITEKNILQCEDAVRNPKLKDKPEGERVCANPKYLRGDAARDQIEAIKYTRQTGICPVCVAVEKAIREKTNPTVIRPFERSLSTNRAANVQGRSGRNGAGTSKRDPIVHGTVGSPGIVRTRNRKKKQSKVCVQM